MNESAQAILSSVSIAFHEATGPAKFRFPRSGWWFEWEGKDIAKDILDLAPEDIQFDDLIKPIDGSFVPSWTTDEGLLWLVPGMIRVVFEVEPHRGDLLLQALFSELDKRISEGELKLTHAQMTSLLEVHEVFYSTDDFDWNADAHVHPLCDAINRAIQVNPNAEQLAAGKGFQPSPAVKRSIPPKKLTESGGGAVERS
jgi:hypothetical protein